MDDLDLDPTLKPTQLIKYSQQERIQIMKKLTAVQNHFNRYLQVGGFPELALADDDTFAQQIMREDVVNKELKRDLPALYNIRNATELERIFLYLCNVSSDIVAAFYYQKATRVGYYRGGGKNKEIDIVVDYPDIRNILLEVKYREAAPITDNDAIVEHCDKAVAAIIIIKRNKIKSI